MGVNVESFAKTNGHSGSVVELPFSKKVSYWDEFLIKVGAKMTSPTAKTSPLEWNGKVVALLGGLLIMVVTCGGLIWYAAGLASQVSYQEKDIRKLELRMSDMEKAQRDADLKRESARGFQMGVAETESDKGSKK